MSLIDRLKGLSSSLLLSGRTIILEATRGETEKDEAKADLDSYHVGDRILFCVDVPADTDIGTIESRVKDFRSKLISDNSNIDFKKMIEQVDTYWDKLFADLIPIHTEQGLFMVQPQRTNNILERFCRDFKRRNRKKSGTMSLSKTLRAILADTPLVKNLDNKRYVDIILNGSKSLEERFAQIDCDIVTKTLTEANNKSRKIPVELKKLIREPLFPQNLSILLGA